MEKDGIKSKTDQKQNRTTKQTKKYPKQKCHINIEELKLTENI